MKCLQQMKRWASTQRGSMLVLTAFAVPLIIGATGLAIDGSNIYLHKSRLQNTADAAALGGAYSGMNWKTGIIDKDKAAAAADKYIESDYGDPKKLTEKTCKPYHDKYYAVRLKEDVPLVFMNFFGWKSIPVEAKSVAQLNSEGGSYWFNDLFIFKDKLTNVNSIENPDNFNLLNTIRTTFDGRIRYTGSNPHIEHSTQTDKLDVFFKRKAQNDGLSVNDAKSRGGASYNDAGQDTQNGYWSKEVPDSTYDMNDYWNNHVSKLIKNASSETDQNPNDDSWDNRDILYYDLNTANNNINLNINHEIDGDIDKPVYLIVKAGQSTGLSVLNVTLNSDTRRPVVICVDPSDKDSNAQVHVDMNGRRFRGLIYAPNMSDEGVLINANQGTFYGSIIAKNLNLQGGRGHYEYQGVQEGGGTDGASNVSLSDDDIDWDSL